LKAMQGASGLGDDYEEMREDINEHLEEIE
jgi:hypothetical protein